MLSPSASEKIKEMSNLARITDLSDLQNQKGSYKNLDYEKELFTFNSSVPQLTQFQNKLISEISTKHVSITRVSVPPQYVFSILNQLIDLQKSEKYNFIKDKIFSAFSIPNDQSSIFFEGPTINEIIYLFSIFRNAFSITEEDVIQFTDVSDIIHNVCNPLRSISFQIGNLIRVSTPSFQNQVVQIIDFYPKKSQILIKFCPRIDYDLLIEKEIDSQIKLNDTMPPDYIAPLNIFEPEKLKSGFSSIDIKKKEMKLTWSSDPIILDFWDNSLFLGPLQCKKVNISDLHIISLDIKKDEIELFSHGLTKLEKRNETFIRNFQMAYNPLFETTENDFQLIDINDDSLLNQNEWNQKSKEIKPNLEFKINKETSLPSEENQKNHKIHLIDKSSINNIESTRDRNSSQPKRTHSSGDKVNSELLKVGDVIVSKVPLENVRMRVHEIYNQRVIKADFLDIPIIGRMNQFSKAPSNASYKSEISVFKPNKQITPQNSNHVIKDPKNQIIPLQNQIEIKSDSMKPSVSTQCDLKPEIIDKFAMYRIGDFIETIKGGKYLITSINEYERTYDLLDFNNNKITTNYDEISVIIQGSQSATDYDGNTLYLFNNVETDDGEQGSILAICDEYVYVFIDENQSKFYKQNRLLLDTSCIFASNNQNNNNYSNNNYSNNNYSNNNYSNNNYSNNDNRNYNSYNNGNNYDNSYNNNSNRNNFNYSYNEGNNSNNNFNSLESPRYSQRNNFDDRKGFNNYNSSDRNQYSNNTGSISSSQNRHTPPPQSKPSNEKEKSPIWATPYAIVNVNGMKEDAIINSVQNSEATIQFFDGDTQRLKFGSKKYQLKDLKPKTFDVGDNVALFIRGEKFVGKVLRLTAHHVIVDISKKKKGRQDRIEGLIKDTVRYYDWESLDDI